MKNIASLRLQKEQHSLKVDPITGVIVKRINNLFFHFCIYQMKEEYAGGVYHGVLELPETYPFAPPRLKFFTPSGRFEVDTPICTTFTNFHKESWSALWNVRSLITATISFMHSRQIGKGGINCTIAERLEFARRSLQNNCKSELFMELFSEDLQKLGLICRSDANTEDTVEEGDNKPELKRVRPSEDDEPQQINEKPHKKTKKEETFNPSINQIPENLTPTLKERMSQVTQGEHKFEETICLEETSRQIALSTDK